MPLWGNTDAANKKPKSPKERQVRKAFQFYTANTTVVGNTSITLVYSDGAGNNLANIGVTAGQFVYFYPSGPSSAGGTAGNGYPGMFASNNTIASVSGNTVILTNATFNTLNAATLIEFDSAINYGTNPEANTYNQDTILITASRIANTNNATANVGTLNTGWVRIQKKTNNDGTVRYLKETLVALANPVASNTRSGNTSFGQIVSGV
jgi:hypothetical protein